ncbi:MAG: RNA methyltransferase, partial [Frankia sp.]|nr:RNA methyltransferase [Frankia sp.]
ARGRGRWLAAAAAAAKQSRRAHWPVVGELASTAEVCARLAAAGLAVVLHEAADEPLTGAARRRAAELAATAGSADGSAPAEIVLVVGPEGGITDEELARFRSAGATVARLGPTVLRTSTAGVAAAAVLLADTGRWDR